MVGKQKVEDVVVCVSCVALSSQSAAWPWGLGMSGDENGMVTLWDLELGSVVVAIEEHKRTISCLEVDWSSKRFLSAAKGSTLQLVAFEPHRGKASNVVQEFKGHTSWVQCLSVDWASNRALSGAADCTL